LQFLVVWKWSCMQSLSCWPQQFFSPSLNPVTLPLNVGKMVHTYMHALNLLIIREPSIINIWSVRNLHTSLYIYRYQHMGSQPWRTCISKLPPKTRRNHWVCKKMKTKYFLTKKKNMWVHMWHLEGFCYLDICRSSHSCNHSSKPSFQSYTTFTYRLSSILKLRIFFSSWSNLLNFKTPKIGWNT